MCENELFHDYRERIHFHAYGNIVEIQFDEGMIKNLSGIIIIKFSKLLVIISRSQNCFRKDLKVLQN